MFEVEKGIDIEGYKRCYKNRMREKTISFRLVHFNLIYLVQVDLKGVVRHAQARPAPTNKI